MTINEFMNRLAEMGVESVTTVVKEDGNVCIETKPESWCTIENIRYYMRMISELETL